MQARWHSFYTRPDFTSNGPLANLSGFRYRNGRRRARRPERAEVPRFVRLCELQKRPDEAIQHRAAVANPNGRGMRTLGSSAARPDDPSAAERDGQ